MSIRFGLLVCVLAIAGGAATAQTAPQGAEPQSHTFVERRTVAKPDNPTVVAPVTVQAAPTPKVIERQSHTFVQSYTVLPNPELDQIVRWRDPLCVQVSGLIPRQADEVQARIADVAKALDLRVRKPGCKANIQIVFTDRPQAFMDTVYKSSEILLGYYHRHDGVRLKKMTRPIQAWHVTATMGEQTSGPDGFEVVDDPENSPPPGCGVSHNFTVCLQSVFKNVLVVVDNNALGDHSLGLVSDYLAMMALAEPKALDGCQELPSVIDIFAKSACPGRDPPDGLTAADAAYLTALYSADPVQRAWVERGDIAGRMAKILIKAGANR